MSNSGMKVADQRDVEEHQESTAENGHFATSSMEAETQSTSIARLPLEMIAKVFRDLDSVSRKRAMRVCDKWYGLLLDTRTLREHVKIDLSYLANTTAIRPDEQFAERVLRTVQHLTAGNLRTRTLLFTDESNEDAPWRMDAPEPDETGEPNMADDLLKHLSCECSRHLHHAPLPGCGLTFCAADGRGTTLLLEKMVLPVARLDTLLLNRNRCSHVCWMEFRDVKIVNLNLTNLGPGSYSQWQCSERGLSRAMSSCRMLCGAGQPRALAQLVLHMGQSEAHLAADEEAEYQSIVAAMVGQPMLQRLQSSLGEICGPTTVNGFLAQIVAGPTCTPLIKRLVIDALCIWKDLQQEVVDQAPENGSDTDTDSELDEEADNVQDDLLAAVVEDSQS